MAALVAIGVFIACLIAGAILMGLGHWVIGLAVLLASLPGAIVAWIKWNDRSYS